MTASSVEIPDTELAPVHHYFDLLYHEAIRDEWDRVVLVIGSEGVGKSTFMVQSNVLWHHVKNQTVDVEELLDQVVWGGRREFKEMLTRLDKESMITVQDAARVFHNLETQTSEQRDLQKDMLDIRTQRFVFLLGFQDWDDVPRFLAKRRAMNALVIPRRGYVKGFDRDALDHKWEHDEWPEPEFRAHFPSLEGLELWDEFQRRDEEEKLERIQASEEPDAEDVYWREQAKTAFRACKPWSDDEGMSYRDAAKLIDYSDSWIGDRIDEWDDGHHRNLLKDEELEAIRNRLDTATA